LYVDDRSGEYSFQIIAAATGAERTERRWSSAKPVVPMSVKVVDRRIATTLITYAEETRHRFPGNTIANPLAARTKAAHPSDIHSDCKMAKRPSVIKVAPLERPIQRSLRRDLRTLSETLLARSSPRGGIVGKI
jgi:hypothetical protein